RGRAAGAGGDRLLQPARIDLGRGLPRRLRAGRPEDVPARDPQVRRGSRLWQAHQSTGRAGPDRGGVAQGIGGAFYERLAYDSEGQLRNASFMEFLMPYATEIPPVEIAHIETPSPLNPLGVKGAGEAGVIPVGAVIASALEEALGVPITEMPLSPLRLFELTR